jgi:hypothetical protein
MIAALVHVFTLIFEMPSPEGKKKNAASRNAIFIEVDKRLWTAGGRQSNFSKRKQFERKLDL